MLLRPLAVPTVARLVIAPRAIVRLAVVLLGIVGNASLTGQRFQCIGLWPGAMHGRGCFAVASVGVEGADEKAEIMVRVVVAVHLLHEVRCKLY